MACQSCGANAPVSYVTFRQNIGMLVMRQQRSVEGNLCKSCIHRWYWKMLGLNIVLGPWGMISLIVTPIFILLNTAQYVGCLGMPSGPSTPSAPPQPALEDESARLEPHKAEIARRLQAGEPLRDVAFAIAPHAGVTANQLMAYARANVPEASGPSR